MIPGFTAQSSLRPTGISYVERSSLFESITARGDVLPSLGSGYGPCQCWGVCAQLCLEHSPYCGQCLTTCGHICD
jgi:hypothetical protein